MVIIFKKKFGKSPPPGIIVTEVVKKEFSEKIETFGTAVSNNTKSFRIKKEDLIGDLKLNSYVKKGDVIIKLKSGNIMAPFNGVVGYTGLTEDIFVSDSTFIITFDDNSIIYSDIKIPENYSSVIEKGLPIEVPTSKQIKFLQDSHRDEMKVIREQSETAEQLDQAPF